MHLAETQFAMYASAGCLCPDRGSSQLGTSVSTGGGKRPEASNRNFLGQSQPPGEQSLFIDRRGEPFETDLALRVEEARRRRHAQYSYVGLKIDWGLTMPDGSPYPRVLRAIAHIP